MEVNKVVKAFEQQKLGLESPMIRVFRSIEDFKRRIDLLPAYKSISEVYDQYIERRKTIITELIDEFIRDQAKLGNTIEKDNIPEVPKTKMVKYNRMISEILDSDIEIKRLPKFTWDDFEKAKLDIPEMEVMEPFLIDTKPPNDKTNKNKGK